MYGVVGTVWDGGHEWCSGRCMGWRSMYDVVGTVCDGGQCMV